MSIKTPRKLGLGEKLVQRTVPVKLPPATKAARRQHTKAPVAETDPRPTPTLWRGANSSTAVQSNTLIPPQGTDFIFEGSSWEGAKTYLLSALEDHNGTTTGGGLTDAQRQFLESCIIFCSTAGEIKAMRSVVKKWTHPRGRTPFLEDEAWSRLAVCEHLQDLVGAISEKYHRLISLGITHQVALRICMQRASIQEIEDLVAQIPVSIARLVCKSPRMGRPILDQGLERYRGGLAVLALAEIHPALEINRRPATIKNGAINKSIKAEDAEQFLEDLLKNIHWMKLQFERHPNKNIRAFAVTAAANIASRGETNIDTASELAASFIGSLEPSLAEIQKHSCAYVKKYPTLIIHSTPGSSLMRDPIKQMAKVQGRLKAYDVLVRELDKDTELTAAEYVQYRNQFLRSTNFVIPIDSKNPEKHEEQIVNWLADCKQAKAEICEIFDEFSTKHPDLKGISDKVLDMAASRTQTSKSIARLLDAIDRAIKKLEKHDHPFVRNFRYPLIRIILRTERDGFSKPNRFWEDYVEPFIETAILLHSLFENHENPLVNEHKDRLTLLCLKNSSDVDFVKNRWIADQLARNLVVSLETSERLLSPHPKTGSRPTLSVLGHVFRNVMMGEEETERFVTELCLAYNFIIKHITENSDRYPPSQARSLANKALILGVVGEEDALTYIARLEEAYRRMHPGEEVSLKNLQSKQHKDLYKALSQLVAEESSQQ
jgi:hypothetical protein